MLASVALVRFNGRDVRSRNRPEGASAIGVPTIAYVSRTGARLATPSATQEASASGSTTPVANERNRPRARAGDCRLNGERVRGVEKTDAAAGRLVVRSARALPMVVSPGVR